MKALRQEENNCKYVEAKRLRVSKVDIVTYIAKKPSLNLYSPNLNKLPIHRLFENLLAAEHIPVPVKFPPNTHACQVCYS